MIETMVELNRSGHSLVDVLELTYSIFKKQEIIKVKESLQEGNSIEDAIAILIPIPLFLEFFKFYIQTDVFYEALDKAFLICKQKEKLHKSILQPLMYPIGLLVGIFLFSLVAVFYLQPQFQNFFSSFSIRFSILHEIGLLLLYSSPVFLVIIILLFIIMIYKFYKSLVNQSYLELDKWRKIPFMKTIIEKYYSIKFCLYYKEFIGLNYDIRTILELMQERIDDLNLNMIVFEFYEKMSEGEEMISIIDSFAYFDDYFKIILKLSLSFQKPETLLEQYYATTLLWIQTKIKTLMRILLPCIYSFSSLYIIGIYVGMILPMMNMVEQI